MRIVGLIVNKPKTEEVETSVKASTKEEKKVKKD